MVTGLIGHRGILLKGAGGSGPVVHTWDPAKKSPNFTLSNGNLTATKINTDANESVLSTTSQSAGKWYAEISADQVDVANYSAFGVSKSTANLLTSTGYTVDSWSYGQNDGNKANNSVSTAYGAPWVTGDTIGIAVDVDAGKIWFSRNGVWQGSGDPVAGTNPAFTGLTGPLFVSGTLHAQFFHHAMSFRPGINTMSYGAPAGFLNWDSSSISGGVENYATGVTGLHCLKRKWTGYSGACIRVRRASDNAEMDIGFTSAALDAPIDSAAILSFGGSGHVYVTTIYDQCGAGNHWVQTTNSKQPYAAISGVWAGKLQWDGASSTMQSVNLSAASDYYGHVLLMGPRTPSGTKIALERSSTVAAGTSWDVDSAVPGGTICQMYVLNGGNYVRTGYPTAMLPSVTVARYMDFDYAAGVYTSMMRMYKGVTAVPPTDYTNGGGTWTVGTAERYFLGSRIGTNYYTDLDWAGDILIEARVPAVNKSILAILLQR